MTLPTVFVCGATGSQGGGAARQLRRLGAEVHAFTRNINSTSAQELRDLGVKLWVGDYDDLESLKVAMTGCSGAFLNFMANFDDFDVEIRQAKSFFAIAHEVGVKHIVYTTGVGVNVPEKLDRIPGSLMSNVYATKQAIEGEVRNAGFEYWTLLRPGHFMTNYIDPMVSMFPQLVEKGIYETAFKKGTLMGSADNYTIGNFAAYALLDPVKFHAQEIEFIDEFLTIEQILEKISAVIGRDLKAVYLEDDVIQERRVHDPVVQGQLFNASMTELVTLEKAKSWGVPLSSWDAFLTRERKNVLASFQKAA